MERSQMRTLACLLILCQFILAVLLPAPAAVASPAMQAATPTPAPTTTSADPLETLVKNLPTIKKLIAKIEQQIDGSQVDVDELALALDGGAAALVDWVRGLSLPSRLSGSPITSPTTA